MKNRRRSRARENPLELIPFLLLAAGAAAAVGTGVYVATRPKTFPAGASATPAASGGPSVPLTTSTYYIIASASPAGLPATADDFALQLANAGWANVAVYYYGPTGQGAIPAEVSVGTGGYAARAMWVAASMDSSQAGSLLGVSSVAAIVPSPSPAKSPTTGRNLSAVAIYGGIGPNNPTGQPGSGVQPSGGSTNPIQNAINQGQNAVNTAQNAANQAQSTAQNLSDQANNTSNAVSNIFGGSS